MTEAEIRLAQELASFNAAVRRLAEARRDSDKAEQQRRHWHDEAARAARELERVQCGASVAMQSYAAALAECL